MVISPEEVKRYDRGGKYLIRRLEDEIDDELIYCKDDLEDKEKHGCAIFEKCILDDCLEEVGTAGVEKLLDKYRARGWKAELIQKQHGTMAENYIRFEEDLVDRVELVSVIPSKSRSYKFRAREKKRKTE